MCRSLAYVVTFRVYFVDPAARKTTKQQPTGVTGERRDLVKNPVRKSLILLTITIPQYGGDRVTSNFSQSWKLLKSGAQVGNYYKTCAQVGHYYKPDEILDRGIVSYFCGKPHL